MLWYRYRLQQLSATLTPWQADTLIGHFAWDIVLREGEEALRDFLEAFGSDRPPFLLSDGCPGDLLPAPASLPWLSPEPDIARKVAKHSWLCLDEFNQVRAGHLPPHLAEKPPREPWVTTSVLHVTLSRTTFTSGAEGSLYSLEERFAVGCDGTPARITFYALVPDPPAAERLGELFHRLAQGGFGKKKSSGKGAFRLLDFAPFQGFSPLRGDAVLTLANMVPAADDPTEGLWKVGRKQGRLGEARALRPQPFKRPFRFLRAGAVFRGTPPRPWLGRLLRGLSTDPDHPGRPGDDVQVCLSPVLPCFWPKTLDTLAPSAYAHFISAARTARPTGRSGVTAPSENDSQVEAQGKGGSHEPVRPT